MPDAVKHRAIWSAPQDNIRNDDPYHAWAFRREPRGNELCPVILKLKLDEKSQTFAGLAQRLEHFLLHFTNIDDTQIQAICDYLDCTLPKSDADAPALQAFRLPDYDLMHFVQSLKQLKANAEQPLTPRADYARIFLAYAGESDLFPISENQDLWENATFEILYTGRPVGDLDPQSAKILRGIQTFDTPKVDLAIIDDSLAFLNSEFFYGDPVQDKTEARSRFEAIWFQARPKFETDGRTNVETLTNGARIYAQGIADHLVRCGEISESEMYQEQIPGGDAHPISGPFFQPIDFSQTEHQPLAFPLSHGTHVASTALRSYQKECASYDADTRALHDQAMVMHGVTLPVYVTEDTSGSRLASYLIAALRQVMLWNDTYAFAALTEDDASNQNTSETAQSDDQAEESGIDHPPLVINLSYGFPAGPKDGSSPLARVIAQMLESRNKTGRKTALVVPMGNSYEDRGVARGTICKGKELCFEWVVLPDDHTSSFLEVFAKASSGQDAQFTIKLTPPCDDIAPLEAIVDGTSQRQSRVLEADGVPLASWSDWGVETGSAWALRGFLALAPTAAQHATPKTLPAGRWGVTLSTSSDTEIDVTAFVQRDDAPGTYLTKARQSYLDHPEASNDGTGSARDAHGPVYATDRPMRHLTSGGPITASGTENVLAAIQSDYVFVAGAGLGLQGDTEQQVPLGPSPYASEGQTPDGAPRGPDFTALTDRNHAIPGVYAAGTYSGTEMRMNGSSVAAPVLAGYLAAHAQTLITGDKTALADSLGNHQNDAPQTGPRVGPVRKV